MTEQNKNELIVLGKRNPLEVFTETEMDKLLNDIRKKVEDADVDLTTDKGRKAVAALAYKVSRSKTALVEMGGKLTEDWRGKTKSVNDVISTVKQSLDDLRDEVRQPLTDWEDAEKERKSKHKESIDDMRERGEAAANPPDHLIESYTVDRLKNALAKLEAITIDDSWQEFEDKAQEVKSIAIDRFNIAIQKRELHDGEQAELKMFREREAERLQAEEDQRQQEALDKAKADQEARDKKTAKEAEEKAEAKAEEGARIVAAEKEQLQREETDRLEQEKQNAIDAKELAEQQTREANEAAVKAAEEAAANERQKIKDEGNQRLADEKKRENDKKHRQKINLAAAKGLVKAGLNTEQAKIAIKAIILDEVPNVKLSY